MTIFERVREEVAAQLGLRESEIEMDSSFEDLGCDSLEWLQIIIEVQAQCGELPQESLLSVSTVGDLVRAYDSLPV